MIDILAQPLSRDVFAPFGDVLEATGTPDTVINAGRCGRFHDLAKVDCLEHRMGISIFDSETCTLPYSLHLMERHPLGSQAFIPMTPAGFLVIVAEDAEGTPSQPQAFLSTPYQSINIHRNVWHSPLVPLAAPGIFAVVDYVGTEPNLEEYTFPQPYRVV